MDKVNIISLGCSKNLIDTELLLKQLSKAGYEAEVDVDNSDANVVVINTCGFIGDAKEESINTIMEQVERKSEGSIDKLFVMGCLSQRYQEQLTTEIPEVDGFFGKFDWKSILDRLGSSYNASICNQRQLTTPSHYAYLKIAEGCDRTCSYCAIPIITGKYQSRAMEDILDECRELVKSGVKELLVIAQDLTYYGIDRYGENKLAELVDRMADIEGVEWIKLHYAYPAGFPKDLLDVMKRRSNVCNYLDIALQHCSDHMLTQMRRGVTKEQTKALIEEIRERVPGIFLRTTLMTGHPGETQADFDELCEFVTEMKFERLGVFAYSHEEDTYCDKFYKDDIDQAIKDSRAETIMQLQSIVSEQVNQALIGQKLKVLIDREEEDYYIGRTQYDSPEVDPEVLIEKSEPLTLGCFYDIEITDSGAYDIFGVVVKP